MALPRNRARSRVRALAAVLAVGALGVSAAQADAHTAAKAHATAGSTAATTTLVSIPGEKALALPAGYVKQGNDYVYGNGAVRVTPALATASLGCSSPWLCLYRDSNWNGTRWEFQQRYWQDLGPYGANDEVSSWSNHTCQYAYLGWNSIAQGINPQFTMIESGCFGHGAYVGDTWNDQASSVLP